MATTQRTNTVQQRRWWRQLAMALVVLATISAALASPAAADGKQSAGEEVGVGFFYSTFGESPNTFLLVGGTAEEFCDANPDDPFGGEPGSATARIRERSDGSVRIKVKSWQPIYVYKADVEGAPPWINQLCATYLADGTVTEPFASGYGKLKVRDTIHSPDFIEIFNKVKGWVYGADGTKYKVRASADLVVENGAPVGDPADFVSFKMRKVHGGWWK